MIVSPAENPFAVMTAVVAPAVLTNACSVLCLATSNRIARVVDRTRAVAGDMSNMQFDHPEYAVRLRQIERLRVRNGFLYKALRLLYTALGCFAASALISVVGAGLVYFGNPLVFHVMAAIALCIGLWAVTSLALGCVYMSRETKLAIENLAEEAELALTRHSRGEESPRFL